MLKTTCLAATTQAQHQVECGLLLDVVVCQGAAIFQLLAGKDQALLVWGNACNSTSNSNEKEACMHCQEKDVETQSSAVLTAAAAHTLYSETVRQPDKQTQKQAHLQQPVHPCWPQT
jgi:hypothetical protein